MPSLDELFTLSRDPVTQRAQRAAEHEARNVGEMRRLFGKGPEGATCGQCAHLDLVFCISPKRFYKCELSARRGMYNASDWRLKWSACGEFKERP